jgi:putative resolvase
MKLSVYAREVGVSDRTAFRGFKSGKIQGRQMETGTSLISEPVSESQTPERPVQGAVYTRVSAAENKDPLAGQAKRLTADGAAQGYPVAAVVNDIGSGGNDTRPKRLKRWTDPALTLMAACAPRSGVVEHQDRLTRFGFNAIESLSKMQARRIEGLHLAENGKEALIQDVVSSVTSFGARVDGPRRSKRKPERWMAALTPPPAPAPAKC